MFSMFFNRFCIFLTQSLKSNQLEELENLRFARGTPRGNKSKELQATPGKKFKKKQQKNKKKNERKSLIVPKTKTPLEFPGLPWNRVFHIADFSYFCSLETSGPEKTSDSLFSFISVE